MNETDQLGDDLQPLPARLAAAFGSLQAARVFVPPAVDAAVLRAARAHFEAHQRSARPVAGSLAGLLNSARARWLRAPAIALGALAVLAIVVVTGLRIVMTRSVSQPTKADIDQNGRVDILDAFALSRSLSAGRPPRPAWDVNGDGLVDQRDVAAVASQAVRLNNGPGA
ncbi:MAG: hypothetical protein HYY24_24390 [Verrucomicrobia bacterium]|nr:hypothetical protein [Verrucomicrobiota bacterium]